MSGSDSTIQQLAHAIATQSRLQSLISNPPAGSAPNAIVQQLASLAAAQQQQPTQQLVNAQQLVTALAAQQQQQQQQHQQQQQQRQQQLTALLQAAQQGAQQGSCSQALQQSLHSQVAQQLASAPPAPSPTQQLLAPSAVQQLASASTAAVVQQLAAASIVQPSSAQQLASASTAAVVQQLAAQQQLASNTAAQQSAPAPTALLPSGVGQLPAMQQSSSTVEIPADPASTLAGNSTREPPAPEPVVLQEVPKCHLHRKLNKACKFCKAFAAYQESLNKETEKRRNLAIEKLKATKSTSSRMTQDEKAPLPNFSQFSPVLADRIQNTLHYRKFSINQDVQDVKGTLFTCDTCEPEVPSQNTVDMTPSEFFCCVHRLLTLKMTEGQLQGFLNNRSRWVRCAGFLYVRLGMHFDRYWELLSDALMDPEEFVPFPRRGGESITEGQYVEQLLIQEKYCDSKLPRIEAAQRRVINERLALYEQFRKRYVAHLDDLEYLQEDDSKRIPVEVCNADGSWQPGHTAGRMTPGRRRATVPVRLADGSERNVSLGMLICPEKRSSSSTPRTQDLTCSQGRSNQELLQEYREKTRGAALSTGKDYCKNSGRHMVHAGGMVFIGGGDKKRAKEKEDSDSEDEERRAKEAKKSGEERREHDLKMAAIMEKYCARAPQARGQGSGGVEAPDRLRLG